MTSNDAPRRWGCIDGTNSDILKRLQSLEEKFRKKKIAFINFCSVFKPQGLQSSGVCYIFKGEQGTAELGANTDANHTYTIFF